MAGKHGGVPIHLNSGVLTTCSFKETNLTRDTSKFGEFISPAEVALVYIKVILSLLKFYTLIT